MADLEGSARSSARAWWAAALVANAVLVVVVAHAGALLTNDGPAHLYDAYARAHLDDAIFAPFLEANEPITGHGFPLLIAALEPALGWRGAYSAALCVVALLSSIAFSVLVRGSSSSRWPLALLGPAFALQHAFYLGLVHWQLGMAIGMLGVAWWRARRSSVVDVAGLALLLCGSAMAHPFAAALAGAVCVAVTCARPSVRGLLFVAVAGAPAALIALWSRAQLDAGAPPDVWPSVAERVQLLLSMLPGPSWRGVVWWALVLVAGATVLRRAPREDRALAVAGGLLFAAAALGPRDLGGWQLIGIRPTPFAAAALLAAAQLDTANVDEPHLTTPLRRALTLVVAVYLLASAAWGWRFHGALRAAQQPVVERIAALRPAPALRGNIVLDMEADDDVIPLWLPYQRLGVLAAIPLGGASAYTMYGRAVESVQPRAAPPAPPAALLEGVPRPGDPARDDYVRRLAALNVPLGALVAFGPAHDLDTIVAAGWRADQRTDGDDGRGVLVATFQGCAARVRVPAPASVDVGFWPLVATSVHVDNIVTGEELAPLGCGPMWFRFSTPCNNAVDGRVRATLVPGTTVDVECAAPIP